MFGLVASSLPAVLYNPRLETPSIKCQIEMIDLASSNAAIMCFPVFFFFTVAGSVYLLIFSSRGSDKDKRRDANEKIEMKKKYKSCTESLRNEVI